MFSEWQKLIHGSKLAGTNLLALIIESFRLADLDSEGSSYRVVLQGLRQGGKSKKLNSLKKYNPAACLYFARAYAGLNQLTGGLVEFRHSAVVEYEAPDIQDYLRLNAPKKSSSKVANTVEFDLIIEELKDGSVNAVEQRPIAWTFDPDSILSEQVGDFDRLVRLIQETPKTALVVCRGNYERVGPKGSPPGLSLSDTAGLSNEHGAGGKGSFVPSKQRARERENSLLKAWNEVLADAKSENVDAERIALIEALGAKLKSSYESIIPKLAVDFLNQEGVGEMVTDYGALLSALANFRPEKFRNQLLRIILSIGNAEIARNGRRPAVCVVCPWHPLRIEAMAARAAQFRDILRKLCSSDRPSFSDERGELFFKECASIFDQPAFPEISSIREDTQLRIRAVTEGLEGYSLHFPVEAEAIGYECSPESTKHSALLVSDQIHEYIRLQPHERDNLSLVLYDCSSPALPGEIVAEIEKHNQDNPEKEITCQIFLMHRDKAILRDMYQQLVTNRIGAHGDVPTEATGDLLSRIRVNVTAANSLEVTDRGEPVDIVYCKDVITRIVSHKGGLNWRKRLRRNCEAVDLFPYRWSRRLPVEDGARRTWSLLSCPAMTSAGWAHLNAISSFFVPDHQDAWENGDCMMPVNMLNFEDSDIKKVFDETHKLGTWVINEDELLERKLLENNDVKVIRYIQAAIHGRNLIISSTSKETLLLNTLRGKLQQILPGTPDSGRLSALAKRFIEDANQISGGLFLKSARRTNNTGELMGMVLSRFLVKKELGTKPTAWCFLDDYAQWLGKREETQMADLLVLSWDATEGTPVLDIVVTEAKFVNADSAGSKAKESAIQLRHSLSQLEAALVAPKATVDQEVWLARLSNLFLSRVTFTGGPGDSDPSAWANLILERKCQVRIRGYSHVFVHSPDDVAIPDSIKVPKTINGIQEIFSPSAVRSLVLIYEGAVETPEDQIQSSLKQVRSNFLLDAIQTTPQPITQPQDGSTNDGNAKLAHSESSPEILTPNSQTESTTSSTEVEGKSDQIPTVPLELQKIDHPSGATGMDSKHSSGIMEYLSQRAIQLAGSKDEGQKWLVEVEKQLRSAFINRQLPYNPVEGFEPILTPNAGIFRLKGKDNLTVAVIETKATEIYTTEGLKILSVEPEPGRLRITISRPHRETLYTEAVLHSFLLNHAASAAKECLIVGIKEEDGQPLLLDPFAQPHSLIAGSTGSGKSVLMQNIILSIAATRSPDESRIFLIDPKYGVDYMALQGLPHISAGSGGVIDSQEEALECLEGAVQEMERRLRLMKEASIKAGVGIPNILAYRQVTGEPMPTWWMIHDEFADWMQTEEYRAAIPALVNRLGVKARAAGIFLIFGAQRPDNSVFPLQLRSQLLNRLVLQVDGPGTSEIALGEKGKKAERLLGKGHMLAKVAGHPDPVFAQVPFIDPSTSMPVLVSKIIAHHQNGTGAFALE